MKKIISLQIGQCGNEIGWEFWKRLALEHGISPDGTLINDDDTLEDRKDVFFYPADDGRYIPRSILIDLEPRVINGIRRSDYSNFYNPENIFHNSTGGGAGNNWASGYFQGKVFYEEISNMVRREVEVADNLQGFLFTHSISGGTGSGLGSFLLEQFADEYKKSTILTYSVFPGEENKDVNVSPYNNVLTLQHLSEYADAVVVLDNTALAYITNRKPFGYHQENLENNDEKVRKEKSSFKEMNMLVSTVMAATTATLRFPSYSNNDLISLLAPLIPTPACHFLMTGYTPISLPTMKNITPKTSVIDVMNRLLDQNNFMVKIDNMSSGVYMSILNILQGEIDPTEIHTALRQIHENKKLRFIPWGPASLQLAISRKSPYVEMANRVSGLMLANHTSIHKIFHKTLDDFEKLFKTCAYMDMYSKTVDDNVDIKAMLREAGDSVRNLKTEYINAESEKFLEQIV